MARREFHFSEGTSNKFWIIDLDGKKHTVQFGKIGTSGQAQTKEFASEEEARKSCDKLIAEKTKKGYAEVAGATVAAVSPSVVKKAEAKPAPTAEEAETATKDAPIKPVAIDLAAQRRIDLEPDDWLWATWRKRDIRPRPPLRPFNLNDCLVRLLKLERNKYGWLRDWDPAGIKPGMSREEAQFWWIAIDKLRVGERANPVSPETVATQMQVMTFDGRMTVDEMAKMFSDRTVPLEAAMATLTSLLGIGALPELIEKAEAINLPQHQMYQMAGVFHTIVAAFREQLLPYATEDELERLRHYVRPKLLSPLPSPVGGYASFPASYYLGALLGMHNEIEAILAAIPNDAYTQSSYADHYQRPLELIFGLKNATAVEAETRRLKLQIKTPRHLRGWLATTEVSALDVVVSSITAIGKKEDAQEMMDVFTLAKVPEVAPAMLQLQLESKAPRAAREWLEENVAHAVVGLLPVAAGRGKLADAAIDYLQALKRKGQEALIAAALANQPAEVQQRIRAEVLDKTQRIAEAFTDSDTPPWLTAALDQIEAERAKPVAWADPGALPPILVGGKRLSDPQVAAVLTALRKSALGAPHSLVSALKKHAERESLDKFAWKLFELWLGDGANSKEKWAMTAIGLIGGDGCVLKMTPLIRAWPGESQHQRAVAGLECLRAVGTDTALMQLNGVAQKLKFKGLKSKAMEMMEAVATDRNMTRSELEDRIVPDCDLDERGTREFDFGPRKFRFVLGPEMKPMIKDPDGKVRGDLPAPNSKDDQAKASLAVETWKVLKKTVKEVAKVQAERLEQSMVTGRRWDKAGFELLLVKHPLMTNLARLVVWAGYDANGKLLRTFRVTEDQTYADEKDETATLESLTNIAVAHPAQLDDVQKQHWGELFSDYELIAPFRQLGRPVYKLEGGEGETKEITRFGGKKIEPLQLVGMLERMAWQRGIPQDGGVFHEHSKPFYGANVTAVVEYEMGVPVGYMEGWEDQKITRCFFVPGIYTPKMYPSHKNALKLGEIDHIVISEVLKDLATIASKAKE